MRFSWRSTLVIGAVGLVVTALMALLALGLVNKVPATAMSGVTRVNNPAPEFTLPLVDGDGEVSLKEYRGRPIVINFWSSWCPPCRQEAPILERVWRLYMDRGVVFIGVGIQDSDDKARAYIQTFGVTYPNGADRDGKVTIDYGVIGLPVTFFVGSDGIVKGRWVGAIDERQLVAWIDNLTSPAIPKGKTEGGNLESFLKFD